MPLIRSRTLRSLAIAASLTGVAVGAGAAVAAPPASLWVSTISEDPGNTGWLESWGAAVAPDGATWSLWNAKGDNTFGTISTGGSSNQGFVLAKQDSAGTWVSASSNVDSPLAYGLTATPDSGAIIAGNTMNGQPVGGTPVPTHSGFLAKFSPAGGMQWLSIVEGGSAQARFQSVSAVPGGAGASVGGGMAVPGYTYQAGSHSFTLPAGSGDRGFLAGLDAAGVFTWVLPVTDGDTAANGVVALADGSAVLSGRLTSSATFGSTLLTGTGAYFAKGNASGWQWATMVQGSGLGFNGPGETKRISAAPDGSIYYADSFSGTATFGSGPSAITLTSSGNRDVFVAKLNPDGTWAWATKAGSTGQDRGFGVSVPPGTCSPVVTGYYAGTATFGSLSLTTANPRNNFVAMIGTDGVWQQAYDIGQANTQWRGGAVVAYPDGSITLQGDFTAPTTFGTLPLTSGTEYSGRMLQAPCSAPQNVKATAGDGKATVSWDAVPGSSVTSYTITAGPGGKSCTATAPATSCVIEGLTNGTEYTFKVVAVNAAGTGPESTEAKATPSAAASNSQAAAEDNPKITIPAASVSSGATLTSTVSPSVAGTVKVTATLAGRTVCTATKKATRAGRMTVTCNLTKGAKAVISKKAVTLKVTARLTDAAGKTATASRNVKVARYVVKVPVTG